MIMAAYKDKPALALLHGKALIGYAMLLKMFGRNDTRQTTAKLGACVLGAMKLGREE